MFLSKHIATQLGKWPSHGRKLSKTHLFSSCGWRSQFQIAGNKKNVTKSLGMCWSHRRKHPKTMFCRVQTAGNSKHIAKSLGKWWSFVATAGVEIQWILSSACGVLVFLGFPRYFGPKYRRKPIVPRRSSSNRNSMQCNSCKETCATTYVVQQSANVLEKTQWWKMRWTSMWGENDHEVLCWTGKWRSHGDVNRWLVVLSANS